VDQLSGKILGLNATLMLSLNSILSSVPLQNVEEELSQLYNGRGVDLLNPKYLNRRIGDCSRMPK
jgi:hypothetical protein